jgi:hypothetical protein
MAHNNQGALIPSFPRKRESKGGEAAPLALDHRFREGDELSPVTHEKERRCASS